MNTEKRYLRNELFNNEIYDIYRKYRSVLFKYNYTDTASNCHVIYKEFDNTIYRDTYLNFPEEWEECRKIYQCMCQRIKRLKLRVEYLITHYNCTFGTLTFEDNVFFYTNLKTRRKYVQRYLNSFDSFYIANIDFGDETEREHYHFIIALPPSDMNITWEYGFKKFEQITYTNNPSCLSDYINKLSNHSIKGYDISNRLIYSKLFNEDLDKTMSQARKQRVAKTKRFLSKITTYGDMYVYKDKLNEYFDNLPIIPVNSVYSISDWAKNENSIQLEIPLD